MKIEIKIKQNSPAWFQHRKNYINASEIATLMGLNPFETKEELIKKKIFGTVTTINEAMQHGKIIEPKANLFFSLKMKKNYLPTVFVNDIFSASLDGYHAESNTLLEIKCPISPENIVWKKFFNQGKVPIYYWVQVQCQIFCSESDKAFFLVYFDENNYKFVEVLKDQNFINRMIFEARLYKKEIDRIRAKWQK